MNSPTRTDTLTVSSTIGRLISAGNPKGFDSAVSAAQGSSVCRDGLWQIVHHRWRRILLPRAGRGDRWGPTRKFAAILAVMRCTA